MSEKKIKTYLVTVKITVRIGDDTWREQRVSKIFHPDSTIQSILDWAVLHDSTITMSQLIFSDWKL